MAEKDTIFSSKAKYNGIFSFKDFYKFCYEWLRDEVGLEIKEDKYSEKLSGDTKEIEVEWTGTKKVTDYFKFEVKVKLRVLGLQNVEVLKDKQKIKTNQGSIEVGVSGTLIRDYAGKFEQDAFKKFMRAIYEKWVITSRVEQLESKLISACDEFLSQAKAYLDLEGRK